MDAAIAIFAIGDGQKPVRQWREPVAAGCASFFCGLTAGWPWTPQVH